MISIFYDLFIRILNLLLFISSLINKKNKKIIDEIKNTIKYIKKNIR